MKEEMMTKVIEIKSIYSITESGDLLESVRKSLSVQDVVVIRNVVPSCDVAAFKKYLSDVGRGSLSNWLPFLSGCPNFHRVNRWDERSYVKGCFHQWSFFPWNQDPFNFFERFKQIFVLRNLISGASSDAFLGRTPDDECIARLSFQFYPKACGSLNEHRDPAGPHQVVVPILIMSKLGEDFQTGGVYVKSEEGEVTWVEMITNPGDLVLFNPQMKHGVSLIDSHETEDWLSFEGRWMAIFAVNKLATNTKIAEAIDLGTATK